MMKWINKKRNKKGFTLVELVVVIAILGVLAAIAVPKFTDVTDNAKLGAAEANHRTLVSAVQMAQTQLGGKLPENDIVELDSYIQGGTAALMTNGVTHTWDGTNLVTAVANIQTDKYSVSEDGYSGTIVISHNNKDTIFTTKFEE